MAKRTKPATRKPAARKATASAARKRTPARPYAGRKLSLKKIVAEIDKVLAKIEAATAAKGALEASDPTLTRAELSLRAARNAVNSACVPEFDIPF